MSRVLLFVVICALCVSFMVLALPRGCGPIARPLTSRDLALTRCQQVARRLHALRGPDGWHERHEGQVDQTDDGYPIEAEYLRTTADGLERDTLVIRCPHYNLTCTEVISRPSR